MLFFPIAGDSAFFPRRRQRLPDRRSQALPDRDSSSSSRSKTTLRSSSASSSPITAGITVDRSLLPLLLPPLSSPIEEDEPPLSSPIEEDKIKVVPAARKFRHAGIPPELEEKLDMMFSQVVATGEDSWAASTGSLPPELHEVPTEEQVPEENNEDDINGREERGNASTASSKRRNTWKNKGLALSYMSSLHESALSLKPPAVTTIKDAVEVTASMEEIRSDKNMYYFALNHIMEKSKREVFMSIPQNDRVWWIKSAYENREL